MARMKSQPRTLYSALLKLLKRKAESFWVRIKRRFVLYFFMCHPVNRGTKSHKLPGKLIISLTSYPPRFNTLKPVLKSLLSQTLVPNSVILWIAKSDISTLPCEIHRLKEFGLDIRECQDFKSYKKIIPAILELPDAFIVTADDDIIYERRWLETMVEQYRSPSEIVFRRGHTVRYSPDGSVMPYSNWDWESTSVESCVDNFPTSGAGALFPPGVFDSRVVDDTLFRRLAPTADDLWLYWMARLAGAKFRRVGPARCPLMIVNRAQEVALSYHNNGPTDMNTIYIKRLEAEFGILKPDNPLSSPH